MCGTHTGLRFLLGINKREVSPGYVAVKAGVQVSVAGEFIGIVVSDVTGPLDVILVVHGSFVITWSNMARGMC